MKGQRLSCTDRVSGRGAKHPPCRVPANWFREASSTFAASCDRCAPGHSPTQRCR
ncbi:hypothetical protein JYU34_014610 [Plutella xylostella]|uniref:Uncharacterized protein n=1 Tax=Plutella xylostella TaxID=51655 RepID=A0ABQ7Q8R6_PLUXY|nr:hypothetical protein JYU34_014610 [Plutella xylostella]